MAANPDATTRKTTLSLHTLASKPTDPSHQIYERAFALRAEGYGELDALHLSFAEEMRVEWLLTTNDRFLARASET